MYKKRHIEHKLLESARVFKILLVTGPRQVGKTTLLTHLFPNAPHITFDPVLDRFNARVDPDAFLRNYPNQTILDEVQFVPELLSAIKRKVDQSDHKGQYLLTGSQHLSVLRHVSETMAGRVGIVELENMSIFEEQDSPYNWVQALFENPLSLRERFLGVFSSSNLYECMWRGSFPGLIGLSNTQIPQFYESYITTYVERDVRLLEDIGDQSKFGRFMGLLAALTAQEINQTELGRELGAARKTAQRWLSVLQYTYQWRELWPYTSNTIKRITKKQKGYMRDTGMACFLQNIGSHSSLLAHPSLGALFETFCVNTIFKLLSGLPFRVGAYHWRTTGGAEVDMILEKDGMLYPIEFKHRTFVKKQELKGLTSFRQTYPHQKIAPGIVVYAGTECYWVDENTLALPWNAQVSSNG